MILVLLYKMQLNWILFFGSILIILLNDNHQIVAAVLPQFPTESNEAFGFQLPTESNQSLVHISRDSYGNIVPPYSDIPSDGDVASTASIQLNKPPKLPELANKSTQTIDFNHNNNNNYKFQIPSYANGITSIQHNPNNDGLPSKLKQPTQDLLPPLSSGNYNFPQTNPLNVQHITETIFSHHTNGELPSQTDSSISPISTLLPPIITESNVRQLGEINLAAHPQIISESVINDPNIYRGGFGGSAGILGEQKIPGYGIKPQQIEAVTAITTTTTLKIPLLSDVVDIAQNQIIGGVNNNKGNKYSGGFGGPPGLLRPYDNL